MREILFKAKSIKFEKFVYGQCYYELKDGEKLHIIFDPERDSSYSVDPKTVCQFTGLVDKNKVKIFEGDNIKFSYEGGDRMEPVVFINGCFSLGSYINLARTQTDYYINIGQSLEVVGNIHD